MSDAGPAGPMFCPHKDCAEFRRGDPAFAKELQAGGINAHYMGKSDMFDGADYWILDGITPVSRAALQRSLDWRKQHTPK